MKLDLITNRAEKTNERNENDEFYTPNYAIEPLLKYLDPKSKIWCPFDLPESNFVKLLIKNGHTVYNTHIDNGEDFFSINIPKNSDIDYIISNPPYSIKFEVFNKLFELGKPFAMLVGVVGLFESQKRFTMFANNDFEIMYFDKRISYFKDYADVKPKLNPPFSSVFLTKNILPKEVVFERIIKK
tara:strand:+ start:134 stop:688 length:555 start_codon:yes stop_codon:yes gene_type:complete